MTGINLLVEIILFILGVGIGVILLELLSILGRPKSRHSPITEETYECGEFIYGPRKVSISFQYYRYAVAFTAVDIFGMFFILLGFAFDSVSLLLLGIAILLALIFVWFAYIETKS